MIQALISGYTTEREIIDAPLLEDPDRTSRFKWMRSTFRRRRDARTEGRAGGAARPGLTPDVERALGGSGKYWR